MVITSITEFHRTIRAMIERSMVGYVSTYGCPYLGAEATMRTLESYNRIQKPRLLLGRNESPKFLTDVGILQRKFEKVIMRTTVDYHVKAWAFRSSKDGYSAVVGSRNLGDSGWHELCLRINGDDAQEVYTILRQHWKNGHAVKAAEPFKLSFNGKTYGDGR